MSAPTDTILELRRASKIAENAFGRFLVPGPPPRYAFADETFRDPRRAHGQLGYYQLAAVLVEGGDVAQFRNDILDHDSRESIIGPDPQVRNKKDIETRRRLITTGDVGRNMRMTHLHDSQEQLLWVPDAVGWAHRRHLLLGDSELWLRVEGVTQVISL